MAISLSSQSNSATFTGVVQAPDRAGFMVIPGQSTAPTGWLLCDGSAVSRTTYADLFTAIGTTYGVGDGSTTFNLPDLSLDIGGVTRVLMIKCYNDSGAVSISTSNQSYDGTASYSRLASTPTAPATGYLAFYAKSDGNFYKQTSAGVESVISGGGGDISNGGNSFGAPITIGTNDAQFLYFETAGVQSANCGTSGAWTFGKGTGSSVTHVFQSNGSTTLAVDSATGATNAIFKLTYGGTNGFTLQHTAASDRISISNAGTGEILAATTAGSWTVGPTTAIGGNTFLGARIVGKNDGATVAAGYVGQILTATVSSVTLTNSGQTYDAASISLTGGVWMVYGKLSVGIAGTTQSLVAGSISLTSATENASTLCADNTSGVTSQRRFAVTPLYVNTTGQSVYLTARCSFTGTAPVTSAGETYFYAVRIA